MGKFFTAFILLASALMLSGCAITSSGNMLGEAVSAKYSTPERKYRFVDVGILYGAPNGDDYVVEADYNSSTIGGLSLSLAFNLFSEQYSLLGQKGGLFLSLPVTLPMDVGVRPGFVQWLGPVYVDAAASFVGGFYKNGQKKIYGPKDEGFGKFDVFILYTLGLGTLFDISEYTSLGIYANWERMAFNSGGSNSRDYGINLGFAHDENYPGYAIRGNVTSLGVDLFYHKKAPFGFYFEYAPGTFLYNDDWWKIKLGFIICY